MKKTGALVTIFDPNGSSDEVIFNGDLADLGQALVPGIYEGEMIGLDVPINVDIDEDSVTIMFAR